MEFLASRDEMQKIDAYSIEKIGIPGIVLMERAALAMEEEILSRYGNDKKILIVTEKGNNGGDGLALGRMLLSHGAKVTFFEIGAIHHTTDSYQIQRTILENLGVEIAGQMPEEDYDIIIDAIFGVGLKRAVVGVQAEVVRMMNEKTAIKIALDVPTGIDATSGKLLGETFQADLTITVGLSKIGLVLAPGAKYAGKVVVKDIGFPEKAVKEIAPHVYCDTEEDLLRLPKRDPWSNKGTYGRVLAICGSKNMAGAAYLSGSAAYHTGVGLVRFFTPEENRVILQTKLPEAIMTTYEKTEHMTDETGRALEQALSWATVIVIGPGLGMSQHTSDMVKMVLTEGRRPLVIDADGLNTLSAMGEEGEKLLYAYPEDIILTPHLKEMSRLTGKSISDLKDDLIGSCQNAVKNMQIEKSREHAARVIVEKDARTVVSDGEYTYINRSGNHGMSVGGSGDVLSGIIAGLIAQGADAMTAAELGTYIHGLAGDIAAEKKGARSMMAVDIIRNLCDVFVNHGKTID